MGTIQRTIHDQIGRSLRRILLCLTAAILLGAVLTTNEAAATGTPPDITNVTIGAPTGDQCTTGTVVFPVSIGVVDDDPITYVEIWFTHETTGDQGYLLRTYPTDPGNTLSFDNVFYTEDALGLWELSTVKVIDNTNAQTIIGPDASPSTPIPGDTGFQLVLPPSGVGPDNFADAIDLQPQFPYGGTAIYDLDVCGGSTEPNEPTPSCFNGPGQSFWYRFEPDWSGAFLLWPASSAPVGLTIYQGNDIANLVELGCQDPQSPDWDGARTMVQAGSTYYVRADVPSASWNRALIVGDTDPTIPYLCFGEPATISLWVNGGDGTGTEGDDVIIGTSDDETIDGKGGDDKICGARGNDVLIGGLGANSLDGGDGTNTAIGGPECDNIITQTFASIDYGNTTGPPSAADDSFTVLSDATSVLDVFANDDDPLGAGFTFDNDFAPSFPESGATAIGIDGVMHYTPLPGWVGSDVMDYVGWDCENRWAFAYVDIEVVPNVPCGGLTPTIDMRLNGGDGLGTPGDDVIMGTDHDDLIRSAGGNDTVCAGAGDDQVRSGAGDDTVFGGAGQDDIRGGGGADTINGGQDADIIDGQGGPDTIYGEGGDDTINGRGAGDTLDGGGGSDYIAGQNGADILIGGPGSDLMSGQTGPDTFDGGDSDDEMSGGGGNDELVGGPGFDRCSGNGGSADRAESSTCEQTPGIEILF